MPIDKDTYETIACHSGVEDPKTIEEAFALCNGDVVNTIFRLMGLPDEPNPKPFSDMDEHEKVRFIIDEKEKMFFALREKEKID
jgi:hypothetical protein